MMSAPRPRGSAVQGGARPGPAWPTGAAIFCRLAFRGSPPAPRENGAELVSAAALDRPDYLTLDGLERLVEATFTRNRSRLLSQVNVDLDKLRLLLRLAKE